MNTIAHLRTYSVPPATFWISVAALLGGMVGAWLVVPDLQDDAARTVAGTYAQVAGTMLGFLIAALSILTALISEKLLSNMRKTGHYDTLVKEMFLSCLAFMATMVASLVGLILPGSQMHFALALATGLMAFSLIWLMVAGIKLYVVITTVHH